mmetsp:Transcript_18726/g.50827  ORF Transcript_18726/g.50827 Transcript_18726/m.50827 type:complete len:330 (+) Transcript_18726:188-1177(+)
MREDEPHAYHLWAFDLPLGHTHPVVQRGAERPGGDADQPGARGVREHRRHERQQLEPGEVGSRAGPCGRRGAGSGPAVPGRAGEALPEAAEHRRGLRVDGDQGGLRGGPGRPQADAAPPQGVDHGTHRLHALREARRGERAPAARPLPGHVHDGVQARRARGLCPRRRDGQRLPQVRAGDAAPAAVHRRPGPHLPRQPRGRLLLHAAEWAHDECSAEALHGPPGRRHPRPLHVRARLQRDGGRRAVQEGRRGDIPPLPHHPSGSVHGGLAGAREAHRAGRGVPEGHAARDRLLHGRRGRHLLLLPVQHHRLLLRHGDCDGGDLLRVGPV